jgi:hypothetical protein
MGAGAARGHHWYPRACQSRGLEWGALTRGHHLPLGPRACCELLRQRQNGRCHGPPWQQLPARQAWQCLLVMSCLLHTPLCDNMCMHACCCSAPRSSRPPRSMAAPASAPAARSHMRAAACHTGAQPPQNGSTPSKLSHKKTTPPHPTRSDTQPFSPYMPAQCEAPSHEEAARPPLLLNPLASVILLGSAEAQLLQSRRSSLHAW